MLLDGQDPDFQAARNHLQSVANHGVIEGHRPVDLSTMIEFIQSLEEAYHGNEHGVFTVGAANDETDQGYPAETAKLHGILVDCGAADYLMPDPITTEQGDLFDD